LANLTAAAGAVAQLLVAQAEQRDPATCEKASAAIREGAAMYVSVTWGHRPTVEVGARETDGNHRRIASVSLTRIEP
jgi:hypothetical protein